MNPTIDLKDLQQKKTTRRGLRAGILVGGLFLLLLIVASNSMFVVGQAEQAVISRFGVIRQIIVADGNAFLSENADLMNVPGAALEGVQITYGKGVHFKVPFVDSVVKFNSRLIPYISEAAAVNTSDKKQYYVTIYARWQAANPALFSITQRDMYAADHYLDTLVFPAIIQSINEMTADDFINNKDLLNVALKDAANEINSSVRHSGIRIADIQLHRTSLPPANVQATHDRMMADRAKAAQQLRSEGQEAYDNAVATVDREARLLVSEATRDAERIKGEGDAAALRVYADAYGRDESFFTYWRSLKALEASIGPNDTLVLDSDHPLWSDLLQFVNEE